MSRYYYARQVVSESGGARREREIHELDQQFDQAPIVPANRSIHQQMLAAGVEIDSHESDLYAKVTPESTRILEDAGIAIDGHNASVFTSQVDGEQWYDLPFKYDPFWRDKEHHKGRQARFYQPTTDMRRPMYGVGDSIVGLFDAAANDSILTDDRVLGTLIQRLRNANDAVREHLDANYRWD